MMMKMAINLVASAALFVFVHSAAFADVAANYFGGLGETPATRMENFLYGKVESFKWKEFDDGGNRLLKESGPRYGVGYSGSLIRDRAFFRPRAEYFRGTVDYDGQTQSGTPVQTDTGYWGLKIEGDAGGIIPLANWISVEPFGGLGYSYWVRDIKSTGQAIGYKEYWDSVYLRLGLRGEGGPESSPSLKAFGVIGVKWPFSNTNTADLPGIGKVKLEPGHDPSLFAETGIRYRFLSAAFFYDSMRFSKSAEVIIPVSQTQTLVVFQPKSTADIFGVNLGLVF
ncbi:MAG: hypothetical protein HZA60_06320 [Deltaproteobacteria bacterium]|nr:hypothetical protein [Deltaproteobacteria bacterium]